MKRTPKKLKNISILTSSSSDLNLYIHHNLLFNIQFISFPRNHPSNQKLTFNIPLIELGIDEEIKNKIVALKL